MLRKLVHRSGNVTVVNRKVQAYLQVVPLMTNRPEDLKSMCYLADQAKGILYCPSLLQAVFAFFRTF